MSAAACGAVDAFATVARVDDEISPASAEAISESADITVSAGRPSMRPRPRSRPPVRATAKFIRPSSAPVLTHASALSA